MAKAKSKTVSVRRVSKISKAEALDKLHGKNTEASNGVYDIKELGSSLRLTSQENVELNHELAREILALPTFSGERGKRPTHIRNLVHHMERGTFHWNFVTLITCRCGEPHNGKPAGTVFRMNGQHTCEARLDMPPGMRAPVRTLRYSASTESDMRRLYSTIDRGAPRTKQNVITSYLVDTPEFGPYLTHVRRYLPAGLSLWKWENVQERKQHDGEDIAYILLSSERDLTQKVAQFLTKYTYKEHMHIMRAPVIGAMFETFQKCPAHVEEFWHAVASGLGLTKDKEPRRRLNKLLMTSTVGSTLAKATVMTNEGMYRACIVYFNAWRKGEEIQSFHMPKERPTAHK